MGLPGPPRPAHRERGRRTPTLRPAPDQRSRRARNRGDHTTAVPALRASHPTGPATRRGPALPGLPGQNPTRDLHPLRRLPAGRSPRPRRATPLRALREQEPANLETCTRCHRVRPVATRTTTGPICASCLPTPVMTCATCGRSAPCFRSRITGQPCASHARNGGPGAWPAARSRPPRPAPPPTRSAGSAPDPSRPSGSPAPPATTPLLRIRCGLFGRITARVHESGLWSTCPLSGWANRKRWCTATTAKGWLGCENVGQRRRRRPAGARCRSVQRLVCG